MRMKAKEEGPRGRSLQKSRLHAPSGGVWNQSLGRQPRQGPLCRRIHASNRVGIAVRHAALSHATSRPSANLTFQNAAPSVPERRDAPTKQKLRPSSSLCLVVGSLEARVETRAAARRPCFSGRLFLGEPPLRAGEQPRLHERCTAVHTFLFHHIVTSLIRSACPFKLAPKDLVMAVCAWLQSS